MIYLNKETDLRNFPDEMMEAGVAMVEAIQKSFLTRIRVSNESGLYVDIETMIEYACLDEENKKLTIKTEVGTFEFNYNKFEMNSMSGPTHTKFYFYSENDTLGLTIMKC